MYIIIILTRFHGVTFNELNKTNITFFIVHVMFTLVYLI